MPDISEGCPVLPEVLDKAKKALIELSYEWDTRRGGLCFGDTMELSGARHLAGHTACHSWASGGQWRSNDPDDAFLVLNCHPKQHTKCAQESVDAYVKWLAKESPFSKFILNRDDDNSLVEGGIVLYIGGKTGATKAEMLWICKTIRYAVEGSTHLDVWKTLYDAGVDPMLAIAVASFVTFSGNSSVQFSSVTAHGNVFNGWNLDATFDAKKILARTHKKSASDSYELFSGGIAANSFSGAKFREFCKPVTKDDGWGGKIKTDGANKDLFIADVLKWEQDLREQFKIPKDYIEPIVALPDSSIVYLEVDL